MQEWLRRVDDLGVALAVALQRPVEALRELLEEGEVRLVLLPVLLLDGGGDGLDSRAHGLEEVLVPVPQQAFGVAHQVFADAHQCRGLGRGQIGGIPRITARAELAHLRRDDRPLGRREVSPVKVSAEDELGGGARVSLEAHHPRLQAQLLTGSIPV